MVEKEIELQTSKSDELKNKGEVIKERQKENTENNLHGR